MPELPEVETIVRGLQQQIIGQKIIKVSVHLPKIIKQETKEFASQLKDTQIQGISRRGKMIIITLSNNLSLLIHLKLSGQIVYTSPRSPMANHTHLVIELSGGNQLRYIDLRQFGYVILTKTSILSELTQLAGLGDEPLKISLSDFKRLISTKKGRIKSLLLNQSFLAGIGNIYADESLHLARIHPLQLASTLTQSQIKILYQSIRNVLSAAILYRGSSISNYVDSSGQEGGYQRFHRVYQREGQVCVTCQEKISRVKIGGRSSYFCPHCQKLNFRVNMDKHR
ncbi:MAG: bifunctional DNA-formamidopyrimidine glycosylase/DNA-(apurinic or apyrimidinic site) lyase [bacterium]